MGSLSFQWFRGRMGRCPARDQSGQRVRLVGQPALDGLSMDAERGDTGYAISNAAPHGKAARYLPLSWLPDPDAKGAAPQNQNSRGP